MILKLSASIFHHIKIVRKGIISLKKTRDISFILLVLLFIISIRSEVVSAETTVSSLKSNDIEVTGFAEKNQELSLLHKGIWLKTQVRNDGSFTFRLPSKAGDEALFLENKEEDGIYRQRKAIVPQGIAQESPRFIGEVDSGWVFTSNLPGTKIMALVDGKYYSSTDVLKIPIYEVDSATPIITVHSDYYGSRSKTIDVNPIQDVPVTFEIDESKISENRLTGSTLPYTRVDIQYSDGISLPHVQTIVSDYDGHFDVQSDYPFYSRGNTSKIKFSLPLLNTRRKLPNSLLKTYDFALPSITESHPVYLSNQFIVEGTRIEGRTFNNADIKIQWDGKTRTCKANSENGLFSCEGIDSGKQGNLQISLGGKVIHGTDFKVHQREEDYLAPAIDWTPLTSNSDWIEGRIVVRFAKLRITYSNKDGSFTMMTDSDEDGHFKIPFSRKANGSISVEAAAKDGNDVYMPYGGIKLKDERKLPRPSFVFSENKPSRFLLRYERVKDAQLQAQVTVTHENGTFDYYEKVLHEYDDYSYELNGVINAGDRLSIRVIGDAGSSSETIKTIIPSIKLDELRDDVTRIDGNAQDADRIEMRVVHTTDDSNRKFIKADMEEDGTFSLDFSQLLIDGFSYPDSLKVYVDGGTVEKALKYEDRTPPKFNIWPVTFSSTTISFHVYPHVLSKFDINKMFYTIHYRDGRSEKLEYDVYIDSFYYPLAYHVYNQLKVDFSKVTLIEASATDRTGNQSDIVRLIPKDDRIPSPAQVNSLSAGDTQITGTALPRMKVSVDIGSSHYEGTSNDKGEFNIPCHMLQANERAEINVINIETGAKNHSAVTRVVSGILDFSLSQDRKSIKIISNASIERGIMVQFQQGNISKRLTLTDRNYVLGLDRQLENHGVIKLSLVKDEKSQGEFMKTFSDTTAPSMPRKLNFTNKNGSYVLEGVSEPYATITLSNGNKKIMSQKLNSSSSFKMQLPSDIVEDSKWRLTISDLVGNSLETSIVPKDVQPPNLKILKEFSTLSKEVTGLTNEAATIYVSVKGKTYKKSANPNITFHLPIAPLPKGTSISIYAVDKSGNKSKPVLFKVLGVQKLTSMTVTSQSNLIRGTGTVGGTITIKKGNVTIARSTVDKKGHYSVKIARQKKGTTLSISSKKDGYVEKVIKVIIKK